MTIKVTYNITDVYVTQDVSPVYINVSYSSGGGSGAAVWGGITGTLSDQTDLQTALDAKFDDPTGTSLQYIDGTGSLQTFPVTLPVLQEVRNQTGATLDAGTVVYINGATGNKPTVTKAIATGDATSAQTLGMVSAAIANNGTGYVVVIGTCSGLDTSAYTEGQQLYLSYTTAGAVTTTKPYAPNHLVYVGIVTRSHPTLGTIEVRVQNGYELDEIHDVDALNPNNNDGLFYNSSTSLWEHKQISTALGYTPANAATTLTINGVTYDLSTSRTWTISTGISGSGASGQVSYWDGTTSQAGSNNLFWDATNSRLGIGLNNPASTLHVYRTATNSTSAPMYFSGTSTNTGFNSDYGVLTLENRSTLLNTYSGIVFSGGVNQAGFAGIYGILGSNTSTIQWDGQLAFCTRNSGTYDARLRVLSNGNVLIQNGGTFTDGGQRLQVQGTTLLNGNVTFSSATGMFWDAANGRLGIGTNSPSSPLHIVSSALVTALYVNTGNDGGFTAQNNGTLSVNRTTQVRLVNGSTIFGANDRTYQLVNIGRNSTEADFYIQYWNGSSYLDRFRLFSTGNFGIGTGATDTGERLQVTGTAKITSKLSIGAGTTSAAQINLASSTAPTSPNNGDIWFDGTDIKMRIGGVTKTFTLV